MHKQQWTGQRFGQICVFVENAQLLPAAEVVAQISKTIKHYVMCLITLWSFCIKTIKTLKKEHKAGWWADWSTANEKLQHTQLWPVTLNSVNKIINIKKNMTNVTWNKITTTKGLLHRRKNCMNVIQVTQLLYLHFRASPLFLWFREITGKIKKKKQRNVVEVE